MNSYSEIFFKSFRMSIQEAYDSCIETDGEPIADTIAKGSDDMQACLNSAYEKWMSEKLPEIDKTPGEYLDEICFDEMAEMFRCGVSICDDDLPAIFVEKIFNYGDEAVDFLIDTAVKITADANEDELILRAMAVRVLGRSKTEKAVLPLINTLEHCTGATELISETVRDALIEIGPAAVRYILPELNSGKYSDDACVYILMSLASIGKHCRSEEIYLAIKKAFNELSDKALIASCLAEYGDGRAIPALRGYLLKNGGNIDKMTFYDIVSAVRKLGGRIDDLKQVPGIQ